MKLKIFGMLLIVIVASIMAVTPVHSQNVMASPYAGQTHGSTRISDVDVAEAAEADNASIAAGANETGTGNMTGVESQNAQSGSISGLAEGEETTNSGTDSHAEGEGTG
ncbi:MAG TPA: hypothetical protein VE130_06310 [Nitrososphaeraceae archaeon]|nr:hypothetical protein [Nitrososphaeraceae archaeon]